MKNTELFDFNKQKFEEYKNRYEYFQLGFFNGDDILIIGQNPGMPFNKKTSEITENVMQRQTFAEFENEYMNMLKISKIGVFIKLVFGDDWSNISFTNIVKIPTDENKEPSEDLVNTFLPITEQQIEILKPKLIVCLGRFAGSAFSLKDFDKFEVKLDGRKYLMAQHPSFLMRNHTMYQKAKEYQRMIKQEMEKWQNVTDAGKKNTS